MALPLSDRRILDKTEVAPLQIAPPPVKSNHNAKRGFVEFTIGKRNADKVHDAAAEQMQPHILRRKIARHEYRHMLEVAATATSFAPLPERDVCIHAVMPVSFHAWDIVPAILNLAQPAIIESLYIATLGFSNRNATELLRMIDEGRVGAVVLACSHMFRSMSSASFEALRTGLEKRGSVVVASRTHAKVIAAKLTDGRCFVTESSANLRSCHNIEQLTMTESPDLFEFHRNWIERVAAWTPATKGR